jgi:hypothetical protein
LYNLNKLKIKKMKGGGYTYTVLGEYINNKTYIDISHEKCNTGNKVRPDIFLSGRGRCRECYKLTYLKMEFKDEEI